MAKKAKKAAKKSVSKKPAKKAVKKKSATKKKAKPAKVKKKLAKKASKPAKKAVKKAVKAAKKSPAPKKAAVKETKAVAKAPVSKPAVLPKEVQKPALLKQQPVAKPKKKDDSLDDDDDKKPSKKNFEYEPVFEYKPQARPKPLGSQPKPFIGSDKRTRYSDEELQEFKEIILKKLEEAKRDYELLKSTLSHKDDHGTDDTSPTFKLLEDGSDVMTREETAQLAARQEKFIQALQNALIRIENKTYGICRVSGKLIPKERLRSVPHATLSIDAKLEQY